MNTRLKRASVALLVAATLLVSACAAHAQVAEAIYTGGDIVTMNPNQPTAEVLAVRDGKILAVGARAAIQVAHQAATTKVIDLAGKTLLPAFIDAHSHYFSSLSVANQVNVYAPPAGPGKDAASIVAELVKFRDRNKISEKRGDPGVWV